MSCRSATAGCRSRTGAGGRPDLTLVGSCPNWTRRQRSWAGGNLGVAELMKEAGLTHGGFYRHFDSREQLIAEAARRALSQGSTWTIAAGQLGRRRGFTKLVNGYLSAWHRDHPESGCGVAGIAADVARADGSTRAAYTHQVQECLAVLADLIDN